jgi:transposase
MAKYSYEFKLLVVEHYLQNIDSFTSTSKKFEVQQSAVRKWVGLYRLHGADALNKRPNTKYSPLFKRSVIEHMRQHMWSINQTAAYFNIPAISSVSVWEKRYKNGNINVFVKPRGRPKSVAKPSPPPPDKPLEEMTHQELLAEVRYLRTEHAYLKKLDALIQRKQLEEKNKQK